jgi:hypothetical protein
LKHGAVAARERLLGAELAENYRNPREKQQIFAGRRPKGYRVGKVNDTAARLMIGR